MTTDAYISIDEIVVSWLLPRGKSDHWYVEAMCYAAEAVRELQFTSLPMPKHTLLTRVTDQNYFTLPSGFTDVIRAGVRWGDIWWPLPIADRLMPYPNSTGQGDLNPDEFGSDMNTGGAHQSWYGSATVPGDFSGDDFAPADFSTLSSGGGTSVISPLDLRNGWYIGNYGSWCPFNSRWYGVYFDIAHGLLLVPDGYGLDEIYLQYIGIGTVDNMTEIPIKAQAAIEAYIDWKMAANKRGIGRGEAADWERKWEAQHRLLRARNTQMSIEDVDRIFGLRGRFGRLTYGGMLSAYPYA